MKKRQDQCPECEGSGYVGELGWEAEDTWAEQCPTCAGTGVSKPQDKHEIKGGSFPLTCSCGKTVYSTAEAHGHVAKPSAPLDSKQDIRNKIIDVLMTPNQAWKGMKQIPIELIWGLEELVGEATADQEHIFTEIPGSTAMKCSCGKVFSTTHEQQQHRKWHLDKPADQKEQT